MAKVRLNDKSIRRAAPPSGQTELWDDVLPGFGLRISAGGARTYVVMTRVDGRLVRRTVGKAPDLDWPLGAALPPDTFKADHARQRARKLLADLKAGIDVGVKRKAKPKEGAEEGGGAEGTVLWVGNRYLASTLRGGGGRLKSKDELQRKLKVDLKPWHGKPITSIRKRDIQALIDAKAEVAPISANRLLSFVKRLFAWAAEKDYIDADPARAIRKPFEEAPRTRYLDEAEIRWFWAACNKLDEAPEDEPQQYGVAGRLFQFCLTTGQRPGTGEEPGECAGLLRSELGKLEYKITDPTTGKTTTAEADAWMPAPERIKRWNLASPEKRATMRLHSVPLSTLALRIIRSVPARVGADGKAYEHVFTSGAVGDKPISNWSRLKDRLDVLIGQERAREADEAYQPGKHDIEAWQLRDLRATCATFLESRLDVPRHVVSRCLGHAEGDSGGGSRKSTTNRYIRHDYDREAADALTRWAALIEQIVGLNVVQIDEARS